MLLAAFTVDLGIAYAQAQAFAAGSDSAALAIAGPSAPTSLASLGTGQLPSLSTTTPEGARPGQEAGRRQPPLRPQGHDRAG